MTSIASGSSSADPTIIPPRVPLYNPAMLPGSSPFNPTMNSGIPPPAPPQQKPGPIKIGFYEVEHTIGKGNHAVVKFARHRITKTEVAIKIINKHRLDAESLKKVYREIQVLKKIKHPHIIKLYQVMESNNMIYLVTEYAKRGELFDFIASKKKLTEQDARDKFWQIISAVDYLHNLKIAHRDLKAENLLLDANYDIKLADFGFSNFYEENSTLNTYCGSPPYAAPEIFEGKQYTGPEIDVWSLGVVLYALVCGVLPFKGVNLQQLRDRVLSGRIRIPYFLSTECENLIRRMLALDPTKRPTIEQIKRHKWMKREEMEPRLRTLNSLYHTDLQEPQPQILRIMQTLQCESSRVKMSLANEAYDNFHGIYLLLLERLRASNAANISVAINHRGGGGGAGSTCSVASSSTGISSAVLPLGSKSTLGGVTPIPQPIVNVTPAGLAEGRAKRRQSDAPRPRPPLNMLREHSTFQTTDCIIITNPLIASVNNHANHPLSHGQHPPPTSEYEENCSTLSRQSTLDTFGSIDEGVESDTNGCSSDVETNGSGNSLLVVNNSPFESFDSKIETDIMSSLNSCPSKSEENSVEVGCVGVSIIHQQQNTTNALTTLTISNENTPCPSPQPPKSNFGEGWCVSDDSLSSAAFPTGQLGTKSKAVPELSRPSNESINTPPTQRLWLKPSGVPTQGSKLSPVPQDWRAINQLTHPPASGGIVPKRISLPENLEFQPQVLLNLKQSIHVEKQLGDGSNVDPAKQVLKVRLQQQQQKRLTKARMQLFRQQSYQLAQRQSVIPSNLMNLRIQEDTPCTPLSPIEDLKSEEVMDTS